jgi:hypothetical protein
MSGELAASTSGWNSDLNCNKIAHDVGDRKLGPDLCVNQWESVVLCSASFPFLPHLPLFSAQLTFITWTHLLRKRFIHSGSYSAI